MIGKESLPTPVFLPGKSREQRSLVGYSPWGHKRVGHDLATKQQLLFIKGKKVFTGACDGLIFNELNIFKFLF